MKYAASCAIASIITDAELNEEYVVPSPFNKEVVKRVAQVVKDAAK